VKCLPKLLEEIHLVFRGEIDFEKGKALHGLRPSGASGN
jgi:hypothetical protein